MTSRGVKISDKINRIVSVKLTDILSEVTNGNCFYWSILFLDVLQKPGSQILFSSFQNQIIKFPRGLFVNWDDISLLAQDSIQIIDIVLVGCKDQHSLKRFDDSQELYESCDIVIEMVDSSFWLVFSKDKQFVQRLASKFNDIEFIDTDWA